ncbi:hypothetical protein L208DRAFT_1281515, partial [Tricholoma matsutake]
MYVTDYLTWHRRLGHPSKEALGKMPKSTIKFPRNLIIPKDKIICPGCAEGKMMSKSFPKSNSHTEKSFELIHSDLKELLVLLYHKHKYFIVFLDD